VSRGEPPRPRVVALGGGHGLSSTLQAVKRYAPTVTAIVSAADDGGSSGKLRDAFGIPPPGDLRKCLVALSDAGSVWPRTFEHRFEAGELEGHALGNLIIAGLASTCGSFTAALDEAASLVGAAGRVLPATLDPVVLKAEVEDGSVEGQVAVARTGRISRVSLVPPDARPPKEALESLAEADQVVIGPGSLYTSVLAALVVPALRDAVASTPGRKVYVCNLRPQEPETAGYDVARHVAALSAHGVEVDVVLYDPETIAPGAADDRFVGAALSRPDGSGHDPARLAAALSGLVG
jgi:uncharacterized cofD-like protein